MSGYKILDRRFCNRATASHRWCNWTEELVEGAYLKGSLYKDIGVYHTEFGIILLERGHVRRPSGNRDLGYGSILVTTWWHGNIVYYRRSIDMPLSRLALQRRAIKFAREVHNTEDEG